MSEARNAASVLGMKKKNARIPPQLKDAAIFLGWIIGLILIAALIWVFTQPVRNQILLGSVNRVLEESGNSLRLGEPLPPDFRSSANSGTSASLVFSTWFTVAGNSEQGNSLPGAKAIVFTLVADGSFFPCLAIVTQEGTVREFIPLSSYGGRIMKTLSSGILKIYTRRIEGAES
ncbi:MAG: hypothetical protein FWF26_00325 [Treponema sp.]|nr:hypothetical protein [Treponema sp.]